MSGATTLVLAIGVGAFAVGAAIGATFPRRAFQPSDEIRSYWVRGSIEWMVFGVLASAGLLAAALYCFNRVTVYIRWNSAPESGRAAGAFFAIGGAAAAAFAGLILSSLIRGRRG